MKNSVKRISALLLCVVMAVSAVAMSASAVTPAELYDAYSTVTGGQSAIERMLAAEALELMLPETISFSDVAESDWFYKYVSELADSGVVSGYPDGTFLPMNNITMGEALKLIMKAAGYEDMEKTSTHWASGFMDKAIERNILDAEVDLDAPADRLAVATMTAKALELRPTTVASAFDDTDDGYVMTLYNKGIITGSSDAEGNKLFKPADSITRAEISAIIWRIQNTEI